MCEGVSDQQAYMPVKHSQCRLHCRCVYLPLLKLALLNASYGCLECCAHSGWGDCLCLLFPVLLHSQLRIPTVRDTLLFFACTLSQAISGYDHFTDNRFCVLFDQAEIDRWHAMLFANERAQDADDRHAAVIRGRHGGARLVRCPVCGQENLREGRNNLVRCWSCTSHFCCACRAWLRGKVGQHFIGGKACKQHGD